MAIHGMLNHSRPRPPARDPAMLRRGRPQPQLRGYMEMAAALRGTPCAHDIYVPRQLYSQNTPTTFALEVVTFPAAGRPPCNPCRPGCSGRSLIHVCQLQPAVVPPAAVACPTPGEERNRSTPGTRKRRRKERQRAPQLPARAPKHETTQKAHRQGRHVDLFGPQSSKTKPTDPRIERNPENVAHRLARPPNSRVRAESTERMQNLCCMDRLRPKKRKPHQNQT